MHAIIDKTAINEQGRKSKLLCYEVWGTVTAVRKTWVKVGEMWAAWVALEKDNGVSVSPRKISSFKVGAFKAFCFSLLFPFEFHVRFAALIQIRIYKMCLHEFYINISTVYRILHTVRITVKTNIFGSCSAFSILVHDLTGLSTLIFMKIDSSDRSFNVL
jgi:hypothetical protein